MEIQLSNGNSDQPKGGQASPPQAPVCTPSKANVSWAPTGEAAPPSGAEAQCKPSHRQHRVPQALSGNSWNLPVSPLRVVIAPNLVTKPVSPISCVMHDPASAFIGQCGLRRQRSHLGSHTQKQVGRGSLGPKPGLVRTLGQ